MKNAKCTNCGAEIEVDETQEAGVCKYCQSAYITEKAIKNYSTNITANATNNAQTIVNNNYYARPVEEVSKTSVVVAEKRPKINWGIAIIGFIFYIFPGVLYVAYKMGKQKEWDEKYLGKK